MTENKMSVSVAVCTYNGERYLSEQLKSLVEQVRVPDEIVICDDGSTDGTVAVIKAFSVTSTVPVRLYVNDQPLGVIGNFDKAISLCSGDIIFLCDQDDIWYPNKIFEMSAIFCADDRVSLVASNNRLVDGDGKPIGRALNWELCGFTKYWQNRVKSGDAFRVLSFHSPISGHAMAFRRSICSVLLPLPKGYHHDRWIAMICAGVGEVRLIHYPLNDYRQHASNIVGGGHPDGALLQYVSQPLALDRSMFIDKVDVYREARSRLSEVTLPDSPILAHLDQLILFNTARHAMRQSGFLRRLGILSKQVLLGRYWTCARGFLTLVRDLLG